jgi:hypothetical protein
LKIFEELKNTELQKNYIRTKSFVDIYIKKFMLEQKSNGISICTSQLSFHNFQNFINFFEFVSKTENNIEEEESIEIQSYPNRYTIITQFIES